MIRILPIVLVLTLAAWPGASRSLAADGVLDEAKMFTPGAVDSANEALAAIGRASGWTVTIRTVDSVPGGDVAAFALSQARAANIRGLYLVISKADHKFFAQPSPRAKFAFNAEAIGRIKAVLDPAFRAKDYDKGLAAAIEEIRQIAVSSRAPTNRVGVTDKVGMFSPEAIVAADEELLSLNHDTSWQVVVETVGSLGGRTALELAEAEAQAAGIQGVFVLIARDDRKLAILPIGPAQQVFTKEKVADLVETLSADLKAGKADQGLKDVSAGLRKIGAPNGNKPSTALGEAPKAKSKAEGPMAKSESPKARQAPPKTEDSPPKDGLTVGPGPAQSPRRRPRPRPQPLPRRPSRTRNPWRLARSRRTCRSISGSAEGP